MLCLTVLTFFIISECILLKYENISDNYYNANWTLSLLSLFMSMFVVRSEYIELTHETFKEYIIDFYNWFQFIGFLL